MGAVVKNPPGWEGPLEKKTTNRTPVFLSGKSYDREAWWTEDPWWVHGIMKELDTT